MSAILARQHLTLAAKCRYPCGPMPWPEAVLLDLGNTLVREPSLADAARSLHCNATLASLSASEAQLALAGEAVVAELHRRYRDGPSDQPDWPEIWATGLATAGLPASLENGDTFARAHLREYVSRGLPLPGAETLLRTLQEHDVPAGHDAVLELLRSRWRI